MLAALPVPLPLNLNAMWSQPEIQCQQLPWYQATIEVAQKQTIQFVL